MQVDVDAELAYIISQMAANAMVNKALRNYARAFIGYSTEDVNSWSKGGKG